MSTFRLLLHVLLAGLAVFLTSVTLLVQLASTGVTIPGTALLVLLGAWCGASSTLRTPVSLVLSAVGVALLAVFALAGWFNFYLNLWVFVVMVPVYSGVWLLVAWRRAAEATPLSA